MPTPEQAAQFALLLSTGLPSHEAIRYFFETEGDAERWHDQWVKSRAVGQATKLLQGKAWQEMEALERIELAITKHYNELAYFLYSRNYSDLSGAEKAKADTCREALERKLAGTAGKLSAIEAFWNDARAGRVPLPAVKLQ